MRTPNTSEGARPLCGRLYTSAASDFQLALVIGVEISSSAVLMATVMFTVLFFFPAVRGWGCAFPTAWNRAGCLAIAYILAATAPIAWLWNA